MLVKTVVFVFLMLTSTLSNAFSVEWILTHSRGKVSKAQAVKIVSAVHKHSFNNDIDPDMIFKIIQNESTYNPKAKARTSNATGLMQIIPRWHKKKIKGRNLRNIDTNVEVGVLIYKEYLQRSNGSARKALWRYNASKHKKQYASKVLNTKPGIVAQAYRRNDSYAISYMQCKNSNKECTEYDG